MYGKKRGHRSVRREQESGSVIGTEYGGTEEMFDFGSVVSLGYFQEAANNEAAEPTHHTRHLSFGSILNAPTTLGRDNHARRFPKPQKVRRSRFSVFENRRSRRSISRQNKGWNGFGLGPRPTLAPSVKRYENEEATTIVGSEEEDLEQQISESCLSSRLPPFPAPGSQVSEMYSPHRLAPRTTEKRAAREKYMKTKAARANASMGLPMPMIPTLYVTNNMYDEQSTQRHEYNYFGESEGPKSELPMYINRPQLAADDTRYCTPLRAICCMLVTGTVVFVIVYFTIKADLFSSD